MNTPEIDKKVLMEYASLKAEAKRIEKRMEELNPGIKEIMNANGMDKITTEFGSFTLSNRTTWKYSEAVTSLQEKEKANGTAKKLISTSLLFTGVKTNS